MNGMSKQQQAVYDFIENYHVKNGISPSMSDIAEGLRLANSTIAAYVGALRKKGYVASMPNIPRSLKIVTRDPYIST